MLYCYYKHDTYKRFAVTNWLDSITGHYYIIMSDFNINFLNWHNIPKAHKFMNLVNWLNNNAVVLMNMDHIIRFMAGVVDLYYIWLFAWDFNVLVYSDPMGSDLYPICIQQVISSREDWKCHWTQLNQEGVGSAMICFSYHVYKKDFHW